MKPPIEQVLIDDAFLHLSAQLPEVLSEHHKGYLQGLKDFRRHLLDTLRSINPPPL